MVDPKDIVDEFGSLSDGIQLENIKLSGGSVTIKHITRELDRARQKTETLARHKHSVEISSIGDLLISLDGRPITTLPGTSYRWRSISRLKDGKNGLALYLDHQLGRHGFAVGNVPNINYSALSLKWLHAKLTRLKQTKTRKSASASKKQKSIRDNPEISSQVMDKCRITFTVSGLPEPTVVISLLDELAVAVDLGHQDKSQGARSARLADALRIALKNVKAELVPKPATLSLPSEAKHHYIPRKSGKASNFLKEHWGAYIEGGVCFRPDIKRLDPKLEMALSNEFKGRADELRVILPTKQDEVDQRLARVAGGPVRPEERRNAVRGLSTLERSIKR